MLSFEEYCESKSINPTLFKRKEESLFQELKAYFEQVHPDSFTAQKLFLINEIRRRYHFEKPEKVKPTASKVNKPQMAKKPLAKPAGVKPKVPVIGKKRLSETPSKPTLKPRIPTPKIKKQD